MASEGQWGHMVTYSSAGMGMVTLEEAIAEAGRVPVECDTVRTARELGVSFGD